GRARRVGGSARAGSRQRSPGQRSQAFRRLNARRVPRLLRSGLLLLLLLGGCATTPPAPTTTTTWESRRAALLALPEWQLQGRIAVNAGKDGGSGNFSWKQVGDVLDFRFNGPLGIGGFR